MSEVAIAGALHELLLRSHELSPGDLPRVAAEAAQNAGLERLEVWLVDHQQRTLTRLGDDHARASIDKSALGDAFRRERAVTTRDGDELRLAVPLVDGADRLGVVCARVAEPTPETEIALRALSSLIAEIVISKNALTDEFERARRTAPMSIAAEMRWSLLPPLHVRTPRVSVAAALEPAYEIAGDAFDYAVNDTIAYAAIFDAVGHGLGASRLANLAVGVYRNRRRRDDDLVDIAAAIDVAVATEVGDSAFITGVIARLDLLTGMLRWVNAGHPPPLVLRGGNVVAELQDVAEVPLGLGRRPRREHRRQLEPNDTVVLYTDGVVEARSRSGDLFGLERFRDHVERCAQSDRSDAEKLRSLVQDLLDHQGASLRDDAAIVLLTWLR